MNFLHYFEPDPILLQIGLLAIHWYGFIIGSALIIAVGFSMHAATKRGLKIDDLTDLALWVVIAGLLGARLYDVFVVDWAYFSRHLGEIFSIWNGGMAIHGAIIGGAFALIVWCRRRKQDAWVWLDLIALALPLAQAIGRWGNYFNQELFGAPTDLPWGIPIAESLRPAAYESFKYFHPAFLYESILDLILFALLFLQFRRNRLKPGQLAGMYLIGYGLIRFAMEFVRIDETAELIGIRVPQLASLLAIAVGAAMIYRRRA